MMLDLLNCNSTAQLHLLQQCFLPNLKHLYHNTVEYPVINRCVWQYTAVTRDSHYDRRQLAALHGGRDDHLSASQPHVCVHRHIYAG